MKKIRAAIDIGTHTARLLIAPDPGPSERLRSLVRKRAYIRLAEGNDHPEKRIIHSEAIDRTLGALNDFSDDIKAFGVDSVHGIATGVVREAENRDEFLDRIFEKTGIPVKIVTGVEEAKLTAKGVLNALGLQVDPFLIFDLGGGSTEFFFETQGMQTLRSVPLGATILTEEHLRSDPPEALELHNLSDHVDECLTATGLTPARKDEEYFIVGTGGTVTTIALMLQGNATENISAERFNGLALKRGKIEDLFDKLKGMDSEQRLKLPGLDAGREGIILAGCLAVIRILHYFKSRQLTVCLSDLLEGILINQSEGENNE